MYDIIINMATILTPETLHDPNYGPNQSSINERDMLHHAHRTSGYSSDQEKAAAEQQIKWDSILRIEGMPAEPEDYFGAPASRVTRPADYLDELRDGEGIVSTRRRETSVQTEYQTLNARSESPLPWLGQDYPGRVITVIVGREIAKYLLNSTVIIREPDMILPTRASGLRPGSTDGPMPSPEDIVVASSSRDNLNGLLLEDLTTEEVEIIQHRYGLDGREPKTYQEIADYSGSSEKRVKQVRDRAIAKLRWQVLPGPKIDTRRNSIIELPNEEQSAAFRALDKTFSTKRTVEDADYLAVGHSQVNIEQTKVQEDAQNASTGDQISG